MNSRPPTSRALLALVLLLPVPSVGVLLGLWILPGPVGGVCYGAAKVILLLMPLIWWRFVEGERFSLSPVRKGGLGVGLASGVVIAAIILGAYELVGPSIIEGDAMRGIAEKNQIDEPGAYLGLAVYLTLLNSLQEEFVWRWFVFIQFERLVGRRGAVVGAALGFTVHHWIALQVQLGFTVAALGSLGVFVGSLCWSWCYGRYRSVWPGYISHILADVAVFIIGWRIIFGG